jgi:mannose-6-phosphate isomerase
LCKTTPGANEARDRSSLNSTHRSQTETSLFVAGLDSAVARLAAASLDAPIDAERPYAELWLGTHVNGAAQVQISPNEWRPLAAWLAADSTRLLGERCVAQFGVGELPFLLKVLSVAQALSIQAHPDSRRAPQLHREQPQHYKDPRHKPEMAVAITPFEALCGFRTAADIARQLGATPELAAALGDEAVRALQSPGDDERGALATALRALMNVPDDRLASLLQQLVARLRAAPDSDPRSELLLRLHNAYPHDVGVFCSLLLNHITLQPGEGVFLAANEPHAYLSGDCVECMACSDNVVRAGLTPKYKDKVTLVDMLTYTSGPVDVLAGAVGSVAGERDYPSPVPEFWLKQVEINHEHQLAARDGPSVVLVLEGRGDVGGVAVESGNAVFVPHNTAVALKSESSNAAPQRFRVFVAMVNLQ